MNKKRSRKDILRRFNLQSSLFQGLIVTIILIGLFSCVTSTNNSISKSQAKIVSDKSDPPKNKGQICIGEKFSIQSEILNEERPYWVFLPKSYYNQNISPKKYPVLFILDGDTHFLPASGLVDAMSAIGINNNYQIPEMIVIAVLSPKSRDFDFTPTKVADWAPDPSGGAEIFLKFMNNELIPQVDAAFRTIPFRILAGHSLGGLFAINTMLSFSSIFSAYIAMDPSIWWDNKLLFTKAAKIVPNTLHGLLYMSSYGQQKRLGEYKRFVDDLDAKNSTKFFKSKFEVFPNENHGSLPLISLYNGLLFLFEGFKPPLNDLADNPSHINPHFKKISDRMGCDYLPPEDLINEICLHASPKVTIDCFEVNVLNYPKSYNAYNALAEAYAKKGNKKLAIDNYKKSLQLNPNGLKANESLKKLTTE